MNIKLHFIVASKTHKICDSNKYLLSKLTSPCFSWISKVAHILDSSLEQYEKGQDLQ